MIAEQLARHLRHNRGVKIDIYRTVIPEGWTPHPWTGNRIGSPCTPRAYAKALKAWRISLRVACLARFTPAC